MTENRRSSTLIPSTRLADRRLGMTENRRSSTLLHGANHDPVWLGMTENRRSSTLEALYASKELGWG